MTPEQQEKEVNSWSGNLGTFEVYDRLREMLKYGWHRDAIDHEGTITPADVGRMLAHAFNAWNYNDTFGDMAMTLDYKFPPQASAEQGVEEAYNEAISQHEHTS